MSLPTYLVFANLAFEFTVLNSMVMPMPFAMRKKYMRFLMTSKTVARAVYFIKIISVFIAILFIDAFRTAYIVTLRPEMEKFGSGLDGGDPSMTASTGSNARKLLAERNMSLTASSLFLSYLIWRVWELNMENVKWGEAVHAAEGQDSGSPIDSHRQDFKANYDNTKPDHEAATRKRALHNKETPVPSAEDADKAEKMPVS